MAGRPALAPGTYGTISTSQLEPGKFRASARYRRWDGNRRSVTATGATEPAARRLLVGRIWQLLQVERALDGVSGASPFGEVAEAWLFELRTGGTSDDARANVEHMLRQFVLPTLHRVPIDEITAESLEPFLARAFLVSADRGRFTSGILEMVMEFAVRNGVVSAHGRGFRQAVARPADAERFTPNA